MKRNLIILATLLLSCMSCSLLDTTPKDTLSPDGYFKTETDLQLFSNTFYNNLLDKNPYEHQSDHIINLNLNSLLHGGTFRTVPANGGGWSWSDLRKMNTLLENIHNCPDEKAVQQYTALTRFFRAFFYFEKVKRFGDVPWIDRQLGSGDAQLYAPRDSREVVMTHMLEDIDFAIANLPDRISTYRICKWTALALKAQFCLYEGTFRKYHGVNLEGHAYDFYLTQAADAARQIMDNGPYRLAKDYRTLFAEVDADRNEYILAIKNDKSLGIYNNCTAYAIMPTQGRPGFTKKLVDSYLMKDGSRFTDKPGWETMPFKEEVADRDPRLAATMRTPGYKRIGGTDVEAPDLGSSVTGFQVAKFVMDVTLPDASRVEMSYNDMPVFRLGEVYLNYAEAKAEAGTLTQDDLDRSVNLLRDRVGMPHLMLADANANPDPFLKSENYGYRNVSGPNEGVILEIRRERGVELAQEGFRWDDLMRWKEGLCVNQPMYGMYFPGPGEYDLTGDGKADLCLYKGNKPSSSVKGIVFKKIGDLADGIFLSGEDSGFVDPQKNNTHVFNEERDYFYPIPIDDRTLNHSLTQNPGWNDGLDF